MGFSWASNSALNVISSNHEYLEQQDTSTWMKWALHERNRGNFDVAEDCYKQGLKISPSNAHLWYGYTTMCGNCKDPDLTRTVFEAALKACPRYMYSDRRLWRLWRLWRLKFFDTCLVVNELEWICSLHWILESCPVLLVYWCCEHFASHALVSFKLNQGYRAYLES